MHKTCMPVYVFEGPDGGGKSTAVSEFSKMIGAEVVHCGPFPGVQTNLARFYVEAMMPALLGYRSVILDRSWLSEQIYGAAFRGGTTRISTADELMLNRLVARCGGVIFACMPPKSVVTENFLSRKGEEYLDRVEQLHDVYNRYELMFQRMDDGGDLDVVDYDYTQISFSDMIGHIVSDTMSVGWTHVHLVGQPTVGSSMASVVIIGHSGYEEQSDADTLTTFPFTRFGRSSNAYWLADQLKFVRERVLFVDYTADMKTVSDWLEACGNTDFKVISMVADLGSHMPFEKNLREIFKRDVISIPSMSFQALNQKEGDTNATVSAIRRALADRGVARATPQDLG